VRRNTGAQKQKRPVAVSDRALMELILLGWNYPLVDFLIRPIIGIDDHIDTMDTTALLTDFAVSEVEIASDVKAGIMRSGGEEITL